jgi:hypothetical protein
MIVELRGCVSSFLSAARPPLVFYGPSNLLAGRFLHLHVGEGLSEFGAPTPEAVEYCIGAGRYAEKLDPPYTLKELLALLPEGLREKAENSVCLRRAFYLSRVDPRPLMRAKIYVDDPLLLFALEPYMPAYAVGISGGKRRNVKCGADPPPPPQLAEAEARVMTSEEFVDFLYTNDIFKQLLNPLLVLKLLWRLRRVL